MLGLGIGDVAGYFHRGNGRTWGEVTEVGIAMGTLYMIVGTLATLFGWDTIMSFLGSSAWLSGLLTGLDTMVLFVIMTPLSSVAGIVDTLFGGLVFEFTEVFRKELHL